MSDRPLISIVVPVYNGAALVATCQARLAPVLDRLPGGAEVVYVDDGSEDETLDALKRVQQTDARVRVVELAGNFGQHAAFAAGFEQARGRYLVTLDADLQCDPEDIPRLIEPLTQGFDLVSGVRLGRRDPRARRLFSRVTTALVTRMAGVRLRDIGCPLNAFTEDVATSLAAFGEMRRFLKPMAVRVARRVTEVEIQHRPRPDDRRRSSYSANRLVRLFMDFFVNALGDAYAWVFLGAAAVTGVLLLLSAATAVAALAGLVPAFVPFVPLGWAITTGLISLFGLTGDYVQRIYRQSSGRPFYLVRRVHETPPAGAAR